MQTEQLLGARQAIMCIYKCQVKMMMIAFIAINNGLIPMIKGLCVQILYFICEIIGGLRSHLLLLFFGRKNVLEKSSWSKISTRLPAYTVRQEGNSLLDFYAIAARKKNFFT